MERYSLSFTLSSLHILLLCLSTSYPTATSQEGICQSVYCGQGTCNPSTSYPFFECDCFSGWKKIVIGLVTFPSCLIPNCTVNLGCGNGSPPPPPPPAPLPPPPLNFSNPCNLVWCADGSCVPNGTGHVCQCNASSANLMNNSQLPCFQKCYLGADCIGLGLLPPSPSPPNTGSNGSPGSSSSPDSAGNNESAEVLMKSWKRVGALTTIWLAAALLGLI